MLQIIRILIRWLIRVDALLHLHTYGGTLVWPVMGVVSTRPDRLTALLPAVVLVTLAFNSFGYMLNDVVDLSVDRTNPLRQDSVLVQGLMRSWQVLALALALIPGMVALHFVFGLPAPALRFLLAAIVTMVVYDLYGKRCRLPLLMDSVLGACGVALVLYGASLTGGVLNRVTIHVALSAAVFALLINAFLNDLRDLANDHLHGARRTAAFLGSHARAGSRTISRLLGFYCLQLQLFLVTLALLAAHTLGGLAGRRLWALTLVAVAQVIAYLCLLRLRDPAWQIVARLHAVSLPMPIVIALSGQMPLRSFAVLVPMYLLPGLLLEQVREAFKAVYALGLRHLD